MPLALSDTCHVLGQARVLLAYDTFELSNAPEKSAESRMFFLGTSELWLTDLLPAIGVVRLVASGQALRFSNWGSGACLWPVRWQRRTSPNR